MRKLVNKKNGERLILNVSGRKAVLKSGEVSTHYTAFIDFDKNSEFEKIIGIRLVNCF